MTIVAITLCNLHTKFNLYFGINSLKMRQHEIYTKIYSDYLLNSIGPVWDRVPKKHGAHKR